jgi:hypothetical protein
MRSRPLFTIAAISLAAFVLGNLLLVRWSRKFAFREVLNDIQTSRHPDLLFVGNSLLQGHIDTLALERGAAQTFTPLNTSLGATDAHALALIALYALRQHPEIRTMVVGFYDYQLTEQVSVTPYELSGNQGVAFDRRIPVAEMISVYGFNRVQTAEFFLFRSFPMAADRLNVWKYAELLRRSMGSMGMPPPKAKQGMWTIHPAEYYVQQPQLFLNDPTHFNTSYERIFSQASANRVHVILVLMPISPLHRTVFYAHDNWKAYQAGLEELAHKRGFGFIDASAWLPESNDFQDALHMTPSVTAEFSRHLGAELVKH